MMLRDWYFLTCSDYEFRKMVLWVFAATWFMILAVAADKKS